MQPVNGLLENSYEITILGERVSRPAALDDTLRQNLLACAPADGEFALTQGHTVAADCFYEEQGRLDGAFCDYDEQGKMDYLRRLSDAGVANFEMEATEFGMFTTRLGIPGAVCCVTLIDRLMGDTVSTHPEVLAQWNDRPGQVVMELIKRQLISDQQYGDGAVHL